MSLPASRFGGICGTTGMTAAVVITIEKYSFRASLTSELRGIVYFPAKGNVPSVFASFTSSPLLHCTGSNKYTAGCVAINEEAMKKILQWAKPGVKIVIK